MADRASTNKNLGWSAEEYAKLAGFGSDWRDTWWSQDYLELIARRHRLEELSSLLDVGCGAGHWGQRIAALIAGDAEAIGVDHEGGFLEAARARSSLRSQRFEYREARAEALPFEDDRFDLVTCQTVLIHVADAELALREMIRVTKPGGLVLVAEPNNLINAMARRVGLPRPPLEETLRLIAFEATCARGKAKLGQGDGSIGERLPQIFQALGLEEIAVCQNERAGGLLPPYASDAQRSQIALMREGFEAGHSPAGDREVARRLFLAGGGEEGSFEELWALQREEQRRVLRDIDAGRYVHGGGYSFYLVSGRKSAAR